MSPPENLPFFLPDGFMASRVAHQAAEFAENLPFPHIVIDDFLSLPHATFLAERFPGVDHPIWLDWRQRSPNQWGKQGPGDASRFSLLDPSFRAALNEFNSAQFISYIEQLTGIEQILPDPHFTGGGVHQILKGGILDIHTDFNFYRRLGIYRRINVLVYLTEQWREGYGGCLELWDAAPKLGGRCARAIPPIFNRAVVFKTDKRSFHGHPVEWRAPEGLTRRSIALYYYTAAPEQGSRYDEITDFQHHVAKPLPAIDGIDQ